MRIGRLLFLTFAVPLVAGAQTIKLSAMTRCTSTTGCNDSTLTLATDSATRSRAITFAQMRKALSISAFDSLKSPTLSSPAATDFVLQRAASTFGGANFTANGILFGVGSAAAAARTALEAQGPNKIISYGDAVNGRARFTQVTIGNANVIEMYQAGGTIALPTAVGSSTTMGGFQAGGFDGTSWASAAAIMSLSSTQIWTNTAHGTNVLFNTTPNNSVTSNTVATIGQDSSLVMTGRVEAGSAYSQRWTSRSIMTSPADGQWNLTNSAVTAGIGLDVTTDGTMKVRNRAQNADGTLTAGTVVNLSLDSLASNKHYGFATGDTITGAPIWNGSALTFAGSGVTITGSAGSTTLIAGTGNSRRFVGQTTTSGGTATTFLRANELQQSLFADGAVTTPGITFAADSILGLYRVGTAGASDTLMIAANGVVQMKIAPAGILRLPNLPAEGSTKNAVCFDGVTFNVTQNAAATCTVSSARFKRDIRPLSFREARAMTTALRPVQYVEKQDGRRAIGIVAEQADSVDARLASRDAAGLITSTNYEQVTVLLLRDVQGMRKELDSLRAELARLKKTRQ